MSIEIKVNSVDVTSHIIPESIVKQDNRNEHRDEIRFEVYKYGDRGFVPEKGQSVELSLGGTKEFGGKIVEVEKEIHSGIVRYIVNCLDHSFEMDQLLALEVYESQSVDDIVDALVAKYATTFTTTNVGCATVINTITFNRMPMSECLNKMADALNYSWYVDEDKDIHFFSTSIATAPFGITDTNGNYLQNRISIRDDLSQLRNSVTIKGSEERALARTETYVAAADQTEFPLANKFAELPTLEVDSVEITDFGVDYIDKEEDAYWNFNEKYVRFETPMTGAEKVEITGIPLFPIIVRYRDFDSIAEYGTYEHCKEDSQITSRDEAMQYAKSEASAYKDGVIEGEFQTDVAGLRSGQVININSTKLGVNEDFLIQSVTMNVVAKNKYLFTVKLATMRTIGIIDVLRDIIRKKDQWAFREENLLEFYEFDDSITITDDLSDPTTTDTEDYYWAEVGIGQQEGFWNFATFA